MSELLALVIEDEPMLSTIFCDAVHKAGFETEAYLDGALALHRFGQEHPSPNLILLDLHLPNVSGPDLLYRIHALPAFSDTVVIVATADPLLAEIYREQADFVLIKPISYTQLRDLAKRIAQSKLGFTP